MPTRLETLKIYYGCRHDGETVLRAASMGEFSEQHSRSLGDNVVSIRSSLVDALIALGIRKKMTRIKIVRKLQDYRALGNQDELVELIRQEARKIRSQLRFKPSGVVLIASANSERAIMTAARTKVMDILNQVIRFCEDEVDTEE